MLIWGGMISSGTGQTWSVVGAYWISSIISLRNTTAPFEVARFSPTLNGRLSTWLTMPSFLVMSS